MNYSSLYLWATVRGVYTALYGIIDIVQYPRGYRSNRAQVTLGRRQCTEALVGDVARHANQSRYANRQPIWPWYRVHICLEGSTHEWRGEQYEDHKVTLFGVRRLARSLARRHLARRSPSGPVTGDRRSASGPAIGVWPGDRRLARRSAFGPVIGVWPGDRRLAWRSAFGPVIGDRRLATWQSARIPVGVSCRL